MTFSTYDPEVDAAVQYAWARGAVLIAAGGNSLAPHNPATLNPTGASRLNLTGTSQAAAHVSAAAARLVWLHGDWTNGTVAD